MIRTTLRRAATLAATAGAFIVLTPLAAQAAVLNWSGGLAPATEQCVGASAGSDARVVGVADSPGVVFRVERDNVEIFRTPRVNQLDKPFYTPGFYRFCAKNAAGLNQTVTGVSITLMTDADA